MRKLVIWSVAVLAIAASAAVASAAAGGGSKESKFSIYLSHGTGEYEAGKVGPADDYLPGVTSLGEIGGGAEYNMAMAEDYQMALSFDFRAGNFKEEPTSTAPAGTPTIKTTSSAWKVRLGGDRTGKIGDRFTWYMGPGLEYGSGKAKQEAATTVESEKTNRYGINGRLGGVMMINPQVGIRGQIGNSFGMASVKDGGGKDTWWTSTFESAWGIQFAFGGK